MQFTKKFWWLSLMLVSLLALGLFVGCEEEGDDDDDATSVEPVPESFRGTWETIAVQEEGEDEISAMNGYLWIYILSNGTSFTMYNDMTEIYSGNASWETHSGNDHMILLDSERCTQLDVEIADVSGNMANFIIPVTENGTTSNNSFFMIKDGGRIAGVVLKADDNTAVSGATVTISAYSELVATTTTNVNGLYEFSDVNEIPYTVEVTAEGYATERTTMNGDADDLRYQNFYLDEASANTGTLSGMINDQATMLPPTVAVTVSTDDGQQLVSTDGTYILRDVAIGQRTVTASADGFQVYTTTVEVSSGVNVHNINLIAGDAGEATISGIVTDSQEGNALQGVTIASDGGASAVSDAAGNYSLTVAAGARVLTATFDGYITNTINIITAADEQYTQNIVMSPRLGGEDGVIRFVLSWDASPRDLDSHLRTPEISDSEYHVYYGSRGYAESAPYATLDRDDTDGFGPETITVYELYEGTYRYYIRNFSSSSQFNGCGAVVQIYGESGLLNSITIPAEGDGNYWNVCTVNGADGAITVVNEIESIEPEFMQNDLDTKIAE